MIWQFQRDSPGDLFKEPLLMMCPIDADGFTNQAKNAADNSIWVTLQRLTRRFVLSVTRADVVSRAVKFFLTNLGRFRLLLISYVTRIINVLPSISLATKYHDASIAAASFSGSKQPTCVPGNRCIRRSTAQRITRSTMRRSDCSSMKPSIAALGLRFKALSGPVCGYL
jgi:hypothetical protein